jgi:dephospho-CoA kinase
VIVIGLTGGIGSGKSTVAGLLAAKGAVVVVDVPLLVEAAQAGRGYPVDGFLVVDVDPEVAVRRLVEQRAMREEDVRARINRQASRAERLARADRVIRNDGSPAELEEQVDAIWSWIRELSATAAKG